MPTKKVNTKEKIANSTLSLIDKKPFPQLRTKEIANKANISEATIFKYYKSKDSILDKIISNFFNHLTDFNLSHIENEEDFRNELITFFQKTQKSNYFKRRLMKFVLYLGMYKQDTFFIFVNKMNVIFFEPIERIVDKGKAEWGYNKNINTKIHVRLFVNSIVLFAIQQDVFGAKKIEEYNFNKIITTGVDNFIKSLK